MLDHASPISAAVENALYQPFSRNDSSINIEGLGLGLSIIKQVVNHHQGFIKLNHDYKDGNHFIVRLSNVIV